jgi:hypothetical protein
MLVQAGLSCAALEGFFDGPPRPGDVHEGGQRHSARRETAVVGEFAGAAVAAYRQPPMSSYAGGDVVHGIQAQS